MLFGYWDEAMIKANDRKDSLLIAVFLAEKAREE